MLRKFFIVAALLGGAVIAMPALVDMPGPVFARSGDADNGDSDGADGPRVSWVPGSRCVSGGPHCDLKIVAGTPRGECGEGESARECCARVGGVENCACQGPLETPEVCYRIGVLVLLILVSPDGQQSRSHLRCDGPPPSKFPVLGWFDRSCTPASTGTPDYQCELVGGQLPPGLSLSGCAT